MNASSSTSPALPSITGSVPGTLDPEQPSRVLRHANSILHFASFDPLTATPLASGSSDADFCRPRRVVIETFPSGQCTWRWVPAARTDPNVPDEGFFPRVVELCGTRIIITQEQWDIYKLDPFYDCYIASNYTVISRRTPRAQPPPAEQPPINGKHRMSPTRERPEDGPRKKHIISIGDSEEDLGDMDVDVDEPVQPRPPRRATRPLKDQNREARRQKSSRRIEKLSQTEPDEVVEPGKRKASEAFGSLRAQSTPSPTEDPLRNHNHTPTPKRVRTSSPESHRRTLDARRAERQRKKQTKMAQETEARRAHRDQEFMRDALASAANFSRSDSGGSSSSSSSSSQSPPQTSQARPKPQPEEISEAEAARLAAIAESRRKLADLERDRPIWAEEAKKRAAREQSDEQARNDAKARREAAARAEHDAKARKEAQARRKDEEDRKQQQEYVKLERERQRRQHSHWNHGHWTVQRALERYRSLSEAFDATKFSSTQPLTFEAVPWPVLSQTFDIQDIDWDAVERFFASVRPLMRTQDFKNFVDKARIRFHPDRWRSRGLLKSMTDDLERGYLEVAVNSVAQAITPISHDLKN